MLELFVEDEHEADCETVDTLGVFETVVIITAQTDVGLIDTGQTVGITGSTGEIIDPHFFGFGDKCQQVRIFTDLADFTVGTHFAVRCAGLTYVIFQVEPTEAFPTLHLVIAAGTVGRTFLTLVSIVSDGACWTEIAVWIARCIRNTTASL